MVSEAEMDTPSYMGLYLDDCTAKILPTAKGLALVGELNLAMRQNPNPSGIQYD